MRIPKDIEQSIEYVSQKERIEKTQSLRKLARLGFESYVTKSYSEGKITLREAAQLLKLTLTETIDILSEVGVKGNIRAHDVFADLHALNEIH